MNALWSLMATTVLRRTGVSALMVAASVVMLTPTLGTAADRAFPSWDRQFSDAGDRFKVLGQFVSAAVLDRETGLVWQTAPGAEEAMTWYEALQTCISSTTGGRRGWRLPTIQELRSLTDPTREFPSMPVGHPFQNLDTGFTYWTATTSAADVSRAWLVILSQGLPARQDKTLDFGLAWCVRGGSGVEAQ